MDMTEQIRENLNESSLKEKECKPISNILMDLVEDADELYKNTPHLYNCIQETLNKTGLIGILGIANYHFNMLNQFLMSNTSFDDGRLHKSIRNTTISIALINDIVKHFDTNIYVE